jgi:integrase
MSVQKRGPGACRVRWQEGDRQPSRTFATKRQAMIFDAEVKRLQRLGSLASLDAGNETLDHYVTSVWGPVFAAQLSEKAQTLYEGLYDHHISPTLGQVRLRQLTPEMIGAWQADRRASGAGPVAVDKAFTLLGSILRRAAESDRITRNPARLVPRAKLPHRAEVRPRAPGTVEKMRQASSPRDATLISVLAYAGLRPGEALGLRWGDVGERTLLIERSVSLGVVKATKTGQRRNVRLLAPLASDLREWRLRSGRPNDEALIFPGVGGLPVTEPAYQSWRRRAFAKALSAAGVEHARPYDLRHSFASLLIHEGRNVFYVARQLGHGAQLTLSTYGHLFDELEDVESKDAEALILAARESCAAPELPIVAN